MKFILNSFFSYRHWFALGINFFLLFILFIILLTISHYFDLSFDFTPNQKKTLPPAARDLLSSIDQDLHITVFYKKGNKHEYQNILNLISVESKHISYKVLNLDSNPGIAQLNSISQYGQAVIQAGNRNYVVSMSNPDKLLNEIAKITHPEKNQYIYFTTGHGEMSLDQKCKELRDDMNLLGINTRKINLGVQNNIPDNASLLVIAGPRRDFLPSELKAIYKYIEQGGKIIFMLEPFTQIRRLSSILRDYNISFHNGIIVDETNKLHNYDIYTPFIPSFARGPITKQLTMPAIFPTAAYFKIYQKQGAHVFTQYLAQSSEKSFSIADQSQISDQKSLSKQSASHNGPFIVSVLAVNKAQHADEKHSEIICFGDVDFITDQFIDLYSNKPLFINSVKWLLPKNERKNQTYWNTEKDFPYHHMSQKEAKWTFVFPVILFPSVFLCLGFTVFLYRRLWS